ncbi:hypothetical protein N7491_006498 [Penicillium cf. griseofulvum]|uniref:Secreted protein n=1 Tax=Penicillium cf. griseofulvum TaxID=2972120 RepID=A0A9W9M341_9EURO|nr:hypothetical protein N7472_010472 [Penicillium cf. griseofulvum]KAJ5429482.1 hypothetical protein N7491_006498 [Penicillium cf. griseofulvum]KAJ5436737.1 hypothetical protein N7445_007622 [Penicillium cf. griseofulvum]
MSQVISRASWLSLLLVALLAVSTVNAHPIRQTDAEKERGLELRSPRIIPDTQNYLSKVLQELGLEDPAPSPAPAPSPTAAVKTEKDSENHEPTQTTHVIYSNSVTYTPTHGSNGAGYTETVKHEQNNDIPVVNLQIGHGFTGNKQVTAEDLPILFRFMWKLMAHQFSNMFHSSDEVGLEKFMDQGR